MSVTWNDQEIGLLELIRPYLNTREIHAVFEALGHQRSMEAISKKARQLGVSFKDFGEPPLVGLNKQEVQVIKAILQDREEHLSSIEPPPVLSPSQKSQHTAEVRTKTAALCDALTEIRSITPRRGSISAKKAMGKNRESIVVALSDSHIGRVVLDGDNREIYNVDIGLERLEQIPYKVIGCLSEEHRKRIDEIVILMVGDHIDGEGIFPHQEMSLEIGPAQQVNRIIAVLWRIVKEFRAHFPLVRIITTRGNHGRTGQSPDANWDNMVFQQLELLVDIENDEGITIKNRYAEFNTFEVRGWKGLIRHRAPAQADTAAGAAKFAGWWGLHNWDFICYGHWHHWGIHTWNSLPIFRNGSLIGGDDYAERLAVHDGPVQLMFGINDEEVPTFIRPLKFD